PPAFYDDLLKRLDLEPEDRASLEEYRAAAEIYQREREVWGPLYEQAIEYPASRIFVALKSGQLASTGRLLPVRNLDEARELLDRQEKNVYDFPVVAVPASFWSLSGIDFKSSAAGNGSLYYCHVACKTEEMLAIFPGDRKPVTGVERVGDCFV